MPHVSPQDYHADAVIEIGDYEGTPVLIYEGGRYPKLLDENGNEVSRYIDVARFSDDGWIVVGRNGRLRSGQWIEMAAGRATSLEDVPTLYEKAVDIIEVAPSLYNQAATMSLKLSCYNNASLSRHDYESLAKEYNFNAEPDEKLAGYGTEYGDFYFPRFALEDLPRLWINQRRAFGYKKENKIKAQQDHDAAVSDRAAVVETLKSMPVIATASRLVVLGSARSFTEDGLLYTVVARQYTKQINEDDPSLYGSHLLGHEGEMAEMVTLEVRRKPNLAAPKM